MPVLPVVDDATVVANRGPKVALSPHRPYGVSLDKERQADGRIATVGTVFLTNRECPFKCLMCDLWTHTLDTSVAPGQILDQLDYALPRLAGADVIKLYNAGSFFDARAIPRADRAAIARRIDGFETVVIENHPRLVGEAVRDFAALLTGRLEVAMGLETVHPEVLPRLNKRMSLDDFAEAAERLTRWGIDVRSFILLGLPGVPTEEAVAWSAKAVAFSAAAGCGTSVVIPTRGDSGLMAQLMGDGVFVPPTLRQLEEALEAGLGLGGRVFADLWDADRLAGCDSCRGERIRRLEAMNHTQQMVNPVRCAACR